MDEWSALLFGVAYFRNFQALCWVLNWEAASVCCIHEVSLSLLRIWWQHRMARHLRECVQARMRIVFRILSKNRNTKDTHTQSARVRLRERNGQANEKRNGKTRARESKKKSYAEWKRNAFVLLTPKPNAIPIAIASEPKHRHASNPKPSLSLARARAYAHTAQ